jgi:hypothetical protein
MVEVEDLWCAGKVSGGWFLGWERAATYDAITASASAVVGAAATAALVVDTGEHVPSALQCESADFFSFLFLSVGWLVTGTGFLARKACRKKKRGFVRV